MDIIVYLLLEGVISAISYASKPKETSRIVTISILTLIITTMMIFLILSYMARADQEKMIVLLLLSGLTAFTAYDFQKEKKKQNTF
jgi:multisubunit Na+/H+ antiporter MnhF subunit